MAQLRKELKITSVVAPAVGTAETLRAQFGSDTQAVVIEAPPATVDGGNNLSPRSLKRTLKKQMTTKKTESTTKGRGHQGQGAQRGGRGGNRGGRGGKGGRGIRGGR